MRLGVSHLIIALGLALVAYAALTPLVTNIGTPILVAVAGVALIISGYLMHLAGRRPSPRGRARRE